MSQKEANRLSLTIRDTGALYASYMSTVKNGGIFIPSKNEYALGDEIFILLTLLNIGNQRADRMPISGKVVWVTPEGAPGRQAGIGVQFSDLDKGATKQKIEKILAGTLDSERATHTM